jgi:Fuc2NAc and GlcNAc transferase
MPAMRLFFLSSGRFSIWFWLILLGTFIVDATVTLLRRWSRGAKLSQAHCSHAYQRLGGKYGSHLKVTLGILGVNIFWLDPLGYLTTLHPSLGTLLMRIAWLPLVVEVYFGNALLSTCSHVFEE